MTPAIEQAYKVLYAWSDNEKVRSGATVPPHVQRSIDLIQRDRIINGHVVQQQLPFDDATRAEGEELVQEMAAGYAARREAEERLADYIDDVAALSGRHDLTVIASRLRECRREGHFGIKPDGGVMIAWTNKCNLVRLCPDESREDTKRLTNFYLPEMLTFAKHPMNRIFYSVFTLHNYRPSDLKRGKKELFDKLKVFIKQFPQIKGVLTIQEDPLSASMDWNVHLNVFFMVKGEFDYKKVRKEWGANVYISELGKDEQSLKSALLEAIKYSAQIVPTKSESKKSERLRCRQADEPDQVDTTDTPDSAPSMIEWPHQRFTEWWDAQQKFRRVRAYGVLYAAHGKRWNRMLPKERLITCIDAELSPQVRGEIIKCTWKEIYQDKPKKEKERLKVKLRHAMVHGEKLDPASVRWLGSLKFDGLAYRVDLITGDNFLARNEQNRQLFNDRGSTGPPLH